MILAAVAGVTTIVLLISWAKLHPFLALLAGSFVVGFGARLPAQAVLGSFTGGFGETMAGVGALICLGAMFGRLLADSGGADAIVDVLLRRAKPARLPWAMSLVGAVLGLPMFFEVGVVLLMPVALLVARRSGLPTLLIALPTLAGLSAMHGFVPPHPGPLIAVQALHAQVGTTLVLGVVVALPCVVLAGPLYARVAVRWTGDDSLAAASGSDEAARDEHDPNRPHAWTAVICVLLPVVLMLCRELGQLVDPNSKSSMKPVLDFLGAPLVALSVGVLAAIGLLGMTRAAISASLTASLGPVAGVLAIVGSGGGFKQELVDTGIAHAIASVIQGSGWSVLLLAWALAALVRVATGSATVATTTSAGILAPAVATLSPTHLSLAVLAVGAGSLFLSHVNDAGFWLVKGYLGTDMKQTLQTWSGMECVLSVAGLVCVLALGAVLS